MFHFSNIDDIKKQSWAILYAWCIGKTSVSNESDIYKTTVKIAEILVENNIWIIHWWYEDWKWWWIMQAYAEWANNIIKRNNLNNFYNIWVPESRFDEKRWIQDRTKFDTYFVDPLPHMDIRCGVLIDSSDFLVVNSLAWNWTLREVFTMYERNDIHKPWNLWTWKISPIIFFGNNRKILFNTLNEHFAIWTKIKEDKNLFFVETIEEFTQTIKNLKNKFLK